MFEAGAAVASLGCIGNRVYTGLADDEMYLAAPAQSLDRMLERLGPIVAANRELERIHRGRAATLGS